MSQGKRVFDDARLQSLLAAASSASLCDNVQQLISQQLCTWLDLKKARKQLDQALNRTVVLENLAVTLQCNPGRIVSARSPVDNESIGKRPCFLCLHNLPQAQRALLYRDRWLILNNPAPLFPDHLVISHQEHRPQLIKSALPAMIGLVADLEFRFSAFYNGPACGASAPDHLHFQMAPEQAIPMVEQLADIVTDGTGQKVLTKRKGSSEGACYSGYLDYRSIFFCVSKSPRYLLESLSQALDFLPSAIESPLEPKVNLIISGRDEKYYGLLFPRKAHRPACYFKPEQDCMVVSPGAVDVAGLIILPRQEDFAKIDRDMILKIYQEVCQGPEVFEGIVC
jgi:hypothetical protein